MGRPAAGLGDDGTRPDRVRTVKMHARHSIASELLKNNRVVTSADLPNVEGFGKAKTQSPDSLRRSGLGLFLLPGTSGLRHGPSLPDSPSLIPRMTIRWVTKGRTAKR